jgi:anti-sigma28 factor (negative regulator of flagellin synthesis)
MKLSDEQFIRVSTLSPLEREDLIGVSAGGETRPEEARRLGLYISEMPDNNDPLRDEIVASLRERIESGSYQVSGQQIAEMLVRRMYADNLH